MEANKLSYNVAESDIREMADQTYSKLEKTKTVIIKTVTGLCSVTVTEVGQLCIEFVGRKPVYCSSSFKQWYKFLQENLAEL